VILISRGDTLRHDTLEKPESRSKLPFMLIRFFHLFTFCAAFSLIASAAPGSKDGDIHLSSPNGNVSLTFAVKQNPIPYPKGARPCYTVSFKAATVVKDSPLGLAFESDEPLERNFELSRVAFSRINENYSMPYGVRKIFPDRYSQAVVSVTETTGRQIKMDLVFRAYDEGVAFRYVVPEQGGLSGIALRQEQSSFYFRPGATAWALRLGRYTTNYESEFQKIGLWEINADSIVGLPLVIQTNQVWVGLTEANITNYAGMYISGLPGVAEALVSNLSPLPSDKKVKAKLSLPFQTPWRVLLVGEKPGDLIEHNYLLMNLNDPSLVPDTSWIRAGKAAWNWWSGTVAKGVNFKTGMNSATMKHYVDFAAEHRLEYLVIDAGWYTGSDTEGDITKMVSAIDIPEIVAYGRSRKVGIILWLHWMPVDRQLDQAFPLYEKWGVAGVKIDFMDRDDQEMVNFYHRAARKAAMHHLLVDFHGAYKPDGLQRTWPNLITREGVLGLEYNKFSRRCTPEHDVTIPFTRMLAGPMDYTPGAFRTTLQQPFTPREIEPLAQGTRCHQLAMYVVFESPLQMVSDYPEAYRGQPGIEFIERVPTTWDETKVISGEVGRSITMARRHGREWYVGSMTNSESRTSRIPLSFLHPGRYVAEIYSDVPEGAATDVLVRRLPVTSADVVTARQAAGGGQAIRIYPAP
jgi:alpha-glucosidase